MSIYRSLDDQPDYPIDTSYQAISLSPNATVLGYLVEHMYLAAIQRGALKMVDRPRTRRPVGEDLLRQSPTWLEPAESGSLEPRYCVSDLDSIFLKIAWSRPEY